MPLTRAFKETVQARIRQDRKYREELLREGVECLLAGDLDTGKAILRDYINATIGFEKLSRRTQPVRGDRPAPEDRGPALRAVAQSCKLAGSPAPKSYAARSAADFWNSAAGIRVSSLQVIPMGRSPVWG